jgi:predicted small secreted protein
MAMKRTSLATAAVLAALTLSACGGGGGGGQTTQGSQPAAATGTQTQTAGTTTATATATAPASSTGATTTATPTGTAAANSGGAAVGGASEQCKAAGLALSFIGGQGATGHGELGFALKNTGSSACATGGYPGIQFLAKDGSALSTTPQHTTDDFFGHLPLAPLTLQPGQSASFRLGVSHGGGSPSGCNTADGLQVIAPNDTATLKVTIPNGASECGTTTVSPLQPGTSAYQ